MANVFIAFFVWAIDEFQKEFVDGVTKRDDITVCLKVERNDILLNILVFISCFLLLKVSYKFVMCAYRLLSKYHDENDSIGIVVDRPGFPNPGRMIMVPHG